MIFTILQGSCQKLMLFLTDVNFSGVDWYSDYQVDDRSCSNVLLTWCNDGHDVGDVVCSECLFLA